MKLFDGHCDTAYELWTRGEGLERNSCHIDLQKAAGLEAYAQVFAFCSNAGRPGGGTERLLTEPLALLRREVEKNRSRIGFAQRCNNFTGLRQISILSGFPGNFHSFLEIHLPALTRFLSLW